MYHAHGTLALRARVALGVVMATWISKIGQAGSPPMTNARPATPLGGTTSALAIAAPTLDDATDGLAAYGYRSISAKFSTTGGTSATFQVWAFCAWFGLWVKQGAAVTVLAGATGSAELDPVGADRLTVEVTFDGAVTSITTQFAGWSSDGGE